MKAQLQKRLDDLKGEFTRGQERLAQLEANATQIRETLLRISGAIQVLEESLTNQDADATAAAEEAAG